MLAEMRLRGFGLISFLVTAVALSACSGSGHATPTPTMEASFVAWTATPVPSPTVTPITPIPIDTPTRLAAIASVAACKAADLRGRIWRGSGATGGQLFAGAQIGNTSRTACRLDLPLVELVGPSGSVVGSVAADGPRSATCDVTDTPFCVTSQPILLLPGAWQSPEGPPTPGMAGMTFSYHALDPNGGGPCRLRLVATAVRMVLGADGGIIDLPTAPDFPWGLVVCGGTIDIVRFAPS